MWLAFHNKMANPESNDPMERESTRLTAVATSSGQTTMDFDWWMKWVPGYEKPHRDRSESIDFKSPEELSKIVSDISALDLISADDPPIFMSYGMAPDAPIPEDPERAGSWKIHHVVFGVKLKEKMDALNIPADLKYPGAKTHYSSNVEFSSPTS